MLLVYNVQFNTDNAMDYRFTNIIVHSLLLKDLACIKEDFEIIFQIQF